MFSSLLDLYWTKNRMRAIKQPNNICEKYFIKHISTSEILIQMNFYRDNIHKPSIIRVNKCILLNGGLAIYIEAYSWHCYLK